MDCGQCAALASRPASGALGGAREHEVTSVGATYVVNTSHAQLP